MKNYNKLISTFQKLPKEKIKPTFLEINKYPRNRFEEVTSRILSFFFSPNKEHNLKDLFLSSLLELLKEDIKYKNEQIDVIIEDVAYGKRIDIVIISPDFVIGIENKITAILDNPLEIYSNRLKDYGKESIIKLVLSVKKIEKEEEIELAKKNGFALITYTDFFEIVKKNIGFYISSSNQKYLTMLFDFIQTLENIKKPYKMDKNSYNYFFDNSDEIENLVKTYNLYKEEIFNKQKEYIKEIQQEISDITEVDWWTWQNWDLGYNSFNEKRPKIGIESSFKETKESPIGEFRIYITTWKREDWEPYNEKLKQAFPKIIPDKTSVKNRVYLHMKVINGEDRSLILKRLKEYFDLLKQITK